MTTAPVPARPPAPPPAPAPAAAPASAADTRPRSPGLLRTWLWGWPAAAQLVLDLLLATFYLVLAVLVVVAVSLVPVFLVGVPLLAAVLVVALGLGSFERARVRAFTGVPVTAPPRPRADEPAWRRYLLDGRPWKALAHGVVVALWGLLAGTTMFVGLSLSLALATLPLYRGELPGGRLALPWGGSLAWNPLYVVAGLAGLLLLPLAARGLVWVDVTLARALLGGGRDEQVQALSARVETLTRTRVATVDSVEVERKRIERDLHDGPQQRLVAIAMDLGMARERLERDPEGARELLDKAHSASKEAITEMRQVARGIHPPVLTDRGLDAALSALAARSPVPVSISVDLDRRPGPTIEAIAYFCVSEALTNVAKHARATSASVDVTRREDTLVVRVRDDGVGGVDLTRGTGLVGLRQRVAAVDGALDVDSPPGGPTVLTVTLPDPSPTTTSGSTT